MKSQGVNQSLKVKSKSSNVLNTLMKNQLNTSSLFSYFLSLFKIKYKLSLISLLGIVGVLLQTEQKTEILIQLVASLIVAAKKIVIIDITIFTNLKGKLGSKL